MVIKFVIPIALLLLAQSTTCQTTKSPIDTKNLTYRNKLEFKNQIRIDGYYFGNTVLTGSIKVKPLIYFFQNGFICNYSQNISEPTCTLDDEIRERPFYWGYFVIEKDTLKLQLVDSYWQNKHMYEISERWARVVNDSTIVFFKSISASKKVSILNETYYFNICKDKPDSTNILMKY